MFAFPLDKLGVINSALAQTGDNNVNVEDDGSDEWNTASPAYDRWLGYMMATHSWGYATQTIVLTPSPTPPQDTDFDTAYPIPSDCVQVIWVKIANLTSSPSGAPNTPTPGLWKIAGTPTGPVIVINAQGGPPPPQPPKVPAQVTMYYISNAGALCDITNGSPILVLALTQFTAGGIYQGLHEDAAAADTEYKAARVLLQEARTRYDQQKPKRQFFNTRITAARRIRRPWPAIGINNWGAGSGDGTPG